MYSHLFDAHRVRDRFAAALGAMAHVRPICVGNAVSRGGYLRCAAPGVLALVLGVACTPATAAPLSNTTAGAPSAADSSCVYVTSFGGDDVCGVHVPDGRSLGCVRTGAKPHGIALSSDGGRLYVASEGADSVSVIDAAALKVISEVHVGHEPNQLALSPIGDRLWVTTL